MRALSSSSQACWPPPLACLRMDRQCGPDVVVRGRAQEDWSRAGGRWAASFEGDTGRLTHRRSLSSRAEWDAFGSWRHLWLSSGTRTCHVPRGTFLFFPLINTVVMPTSREARGFAETAIDESPRNRGRARPVGTRSGWQARAGSRAAVGRRTEDCSGMAATHRLRPHVHRPPTATTSCCAPCNRGRTRSTSAAALPGLSQVT